MNQLLTFQLYAESAPTPWAVPKEFHPRDTLSLDVFMATNIKLLHYISGRGDGPGVIREEATDSTGFLG